MRAVEYPSSGALCYPGAILAVFDQVRTLSLGLRASDATWSGFMRSTDTVDRMKPAHVADGGCFL